MTSNDADAITIKLRELISVNKEQIAEMKTLAAQMQRDNAEFRALMIKEFSDFKSKVKQDIKEIRQDMKELRAEVVVLQRDVEGIKHDVAALFHWDYWILTFIAAALVPAFVRDYEDSCRGCLSGRFRCCFALQEGEKLRCLMSLMALCS